MKNSRKKNVIWFVVIVLTILRIAYFVRMPYIAIGNTGYDDQYLMELAGSIISKNWLGEYCSTTLIKGISYPLFIVFSNYTCIPYSVLLGMFYVLSCAVFAWALKKLFDSDAVAACGYLFLLYTPAGFAVKVAQRLYRNAIIFPSVLLVTGCILLVYIYRKETVKKQLMWLVLLGFSFSFFYYIREDSFWLLPLFVCSLLIVAVWNIFFSGFERKKIAIRSVILFLPVLIFAGCSWIYKGINYKEYGVFTTNDRTSGSFAELTGNMIKIKDESGAGEDYWISEDKLKKIIAECPSLSNDEEVYLSYYSRRAQEGDNGNAKGDWSVWEIRSAFSYLGYYTDAVTIDNFCRQVNEELLQAVEEGRLEFDDAIHFTSQSRGVYVDEIPGFVGDTLKNIWNVVTFKDAYSELETDIGDEETVRYMESIAGVMTIRSTDDPNYVYSERIVRSANGITKLYKYVNVLFTVVAMMCFFVLCYRFVRNKSWDNFEPVVILLGFLLSVFLYEFGVTVFNTWLGDIWFYSTGLVPIFQSFEVLGIAYVAKNFRGKMSFSRR